MYARIMNIYNIMIVDVVRDKFLSFDFILLRRQSFALRCDATVSLCKMIAFTAQFCSWYLFASFVGRLYAQECCKTICEKKKKKKGKKNCMHVVITQLCNKSFMFHVSCLINFFCVRTLVVILFIIIILLLRYCALQITRTHCDCSGIHKAKLLWDVPTQTTLFSKTLFCTYTIHTPQVPYVIFVLHFCFHLYSL